MNFGETKNILYILLEEELAEAVVRRTVARGWDAGNDLPASLLDDDRRILTLEERVFILELQSGKIKEGCMSGQQVDKVDSGQRRRAVACDCGRSLRRCDVDHVSTPALLSHSDRRVFSSKPQVTLHPLSKYSHRMLSSRLQDML